MEGDSDMDTAIAFILVFAVLVTALNFFVEIIVPIAIFAFLFYAIGGVDYIRELIKYCKVRWGSKWKD